jgi:mannosyltransferase OCH1-like enzyme
MINNIPIHQILINDSNKLPNQLPSYAQFCINEMVRYFPYAIPHLYSGEELESFIKDNFGAEVLHAYMSLKPYSYKSDLARYCLLNYYGGIYVDLNTRFINSLPMDHISKYSFFAFRDHHALSQKSWSVSTTIQYSKPKSFVTEKSIEIILENVKNKYYGHWAHFPTGPAVLGKAIMASQHEDVLTAGEMFCLTPLHEQKWFAFIFDNADIVALRKPTVGGDIESLGFEGTNNYVEMWKAKNVYV